MSTLLRQSKKYSDFTQKNFFQECVILNLSIFKFKCAEKGKTVWLTVDKRLSAVHLCIKSPILTSTVSGIGVAGTYTPSLLHTYM